MFLVARESPQLPATNNSPARKKDSVIHKGPPGCKESQFYSLPLGQTGAEM